MSGVDSVNGTLRFQRWSLYDWVKGVDALEIRPALVDVSGMTGKEGDVSWTPISHFEFKNVIDRLLSIFDELEDFGYVNKDEYDVEHFYADGLIEGSAITIRLYTDPEDAEPLDDGGDDDDADEE